MSHISKIAVKIKSLAALGAACEQLGLVFDAGATTHRYYGGMKNPCSGKISVKDNTEAYEMGLVANGDGSFSLAWDKFAGGRGLVDVVGDNASKLRQEYSAQVAIQQARRQGFNRVTRKINTDGSLVMEISR